MSPQTLLRRAVIAALGTALLSTSVSAVAAPAAPARIRPELQKEVLVPGGTAAPARPVPQSETDQHKLTSLPKPSWPGNGAAEVVLPADAPSARTRSAPTPDQVEHRKAGALPVAVGLVRKDEPQARSAPAAESKVKVETFDQKTTEAAGVNGVLLKLTNAGGAAGATVSVQVDYSAFAHAYGGDYGTRLRLVQYPGCVLTTPDRPECRLSTPVRTDNHTKNRNVTAQVPLQSAGARERSGQDASGAVVLAATAAPNGGSGDYKATSLAPSGSWSAGGSSGDFGYSVPMRVPPPIGGEAPSLALGYSSGSMDGRTSATNSQASWAGDGWDLSPGGFVERQYKGCTEDKDGNQGSRETGDSCWYDDNATLVLGGSSVELVKDTANNRWRPKKDDGSYVELLKGAANGDNDGEHWKVTTTDGTQYFLGLNRLPGWDSADPAKREETKSTWTVPVYGNHAGEPCHKVSEFPASFCQQAWRWNLDYVIDRLGNVTSYYYNTELNHYARNKTLSAPTQYVRAGQLKRIEYGLREGAVHADPAMQVRFETAERCLPEGAITCAEDQLNKDTAKHWPDVPFEQLCDGKKECTGLYSPTFFTRKRLTKVVTELRKDDGSGYRPVDSWTLRHTFPTGGDGPFPALWLAGVTHTGHVDGTASTPEVKFGGTAKPNRVDLDASQPPITRYRLTSIQNETGGHTEVKYSEADCRAGRMPAKPETNTYRCYPVFWAPPGAPDPSMDYFHKYVVTAVIDDDRTGGSQLVKTFYEYKPDSGAWHFDSNRFAKMEHRTWSEWRGYGEVRTVKGEPGTTQTVSDTFYLRGMDEDRQPNNGKRDVHIPVRDTVDGKITPVEDHERLQGQVLETIQYDNGKAVSGTINLPVLKGPTAVNGEGKSFFVNIGTTYSRTLMPDGTWRRTKIATSYDDKYGIAERVDDTGDIAVTGDERCMRTTYARNERTWVLGLASRVQTVALPCEAGTGTPADLVSDIRSHYDGGEFAAAATRGLVTQTERWDGTKYQVLTKAKHDEYGRVTESWDAQNIRTTREYTPKTGMPAREVLATNPLGHQVRQTLEPAWGATKTEIGVNDERTDLVYDGLGRLTQVWTPIHSRQANPGTPNLAYDYEMRTDAPTVVTAKTLQDNGKYLEAYRFYDGLLRERQTQSPGVGKGRVIGDSFYDSRGLPVKVNNAYVADGSISKTLFGVKDNVIPNQTVVEYDGLERETASIYRRYAEEQWRNTARYEGDRKHVTPPAGGVPVTEIVNAQGKVVERRQYHGGQSLGTYDAMTYAYTPVGELKEVKDAKGNSWGYKYDHLGRKYEDNDPDRGKTTYRFNEYDQLQSTTDAENRTLSYGYDELGRKRTMHEETTTGRVLHAEWTYDTVKKGLLTSATRYIGGHPYVSRVSEYDGTGKPLTSVVQIPAQEGKLAGRYIYTNTYKPISGAPETSTLPAAGGLEQEKIEFGYNDHGLPVSAAGVNTYVGKHLYTAFGETLAMDVGDGSNVTYLTNFRNESTRRLDRAVLDRNTPERAHVSDRYYDYDQVGNILRIADTPVGGQTDTQCFRYEDPFRRLSKAFTPKGSDCAADPKSMADLGGAAPYWTDYEYDVVGNRTQEVQHTGQGLFARTFHHPEPTKPQPHTVTSVTRKGPDGESRDDYTYDLTGNTTSRKISGSTQTLKWNAEGKLSQVSEPGNKVSRYEYDTNGARLLKRENGTTTLYLPGMELMLPAGGEVTAKRYYTHAGGTVAIRGSVSGLSLMAPDHQGTSTVSFNGTNLAVDKRYQDPFGIPRGAESGAWPDDKGFQGGTRDVTGLTHIGAREYDPSLGRFISVDPLMDLSDPQQMHGYAYANGSPITYSDPTGLAPDCRPTCYWGGENFNRVTPPGWSRAQRVAEETPRLNRAIARHHATKGTGGAPAPKTQPKHYYHEQSQFEGFLEGARDVLVGTFEATKDLVLGLLDCQTGGWLPVGKEAGLVSRLSGTITCGQLVGGVESTFLNIPETIDKMVEPMQQALEAGDYGWAAGTAAATVFEAVAGAGGLKNAIKRAKPCNSFVPGTLVLLADGSSKPIEALVVGDMVLATDPVTDHTEAREVVATITDEGQKNLIDITVNTDGPRGSLKEIVTATANHPFWVDSQERWLDASQLRTGDQVLGSNREKISIDHVEPRREIRKVFNLTIDELHTYYVRAGNAFFLTHNAGECPVNGVPHGKIGEAATLQRLGAEGYTNVVSEVRFKGSQGQVFRADFVARDPAGNWVAIEVKTGNGAGLTQNQRSGYNELASSGAVVNTSKVPGLAKGSVVKMRVEVDMWDCPACGP
ncbi:RHS repeat-associated protein [Crossiella equi]|uniref:RHS repeat-associated protein n=1 Tax=Crossiella equi TaxID=130796 RepID=A0ABS5APW0_9PSEU|nr:polymorphic toxin-type HINT domain-containing protein [Crossiella equi]MBP2478606.1 RHS repeat-associated protein [Crossiella equi]